MYRRMPKSGQELSVLGFGCMRFPTDAEGTIDETKATEMLHYAIENGVNYI
ncbi:MAG: aldo/keto reductase, partial [Firmicutes bacterium]|nr:aldo/keto reductase [Bacillota bacterium]